MGMGRFILCAYELNGFDFTALYIWIACLDYIFIYVLGFKLTMQELFFTKIFSIEITAFLLGILCSSPYLPSLGGVQCDLGD